MGGLELVIVGGAVDVAGDLDGGMTGELGGGGEGHAVGQPSADGAMPEVVGVEAGFDVGLLGYAFERLVDAVFAERFPEVAVGVGADEYMIILGGWADLQPGAESFNGFWFELEGSLFVVSSPALFSDNCPALFKVEVSQAEAGNSTHAAGAVGEYANDGSLADVLVSLGNGQHLLNVGLGDAAPALSGERGPLEAGGGVGVDVAFEETPAEEAPGGANVLVYGVDGELSGAVGFGCVAAGAEMPGLPVAVGDMGSPAA